MGAPLVKTRTILRLSPEENVGPVFVAWLPGDSPEDYRATSLVLDTDVWDDMGRPETITVTIEPGDLLNE